MIYRPMYVDKIMAYVDTPFVKVLTGFLLMEKHICFLTRFRKSKTGKRL